MFGIMTFTHVTDATQFYMTQNPANKLESLWQLNIRQFKTLKPKYVIIMLKTGVLLCKDLDTNLDVKRYCLGSEMLTHCQLLTAIAGFVCSICFFGGNCWFLQKPH
jgi:hypothetical protein